MGSSIGRPRIGRFAALVLPSLVPVALLTALVVTVTYGQVRRSLEQNFLAEIRQSKTSLDVMINQAEVIYRFLSVSSDAYFDAKAVLTNAASAGLLDSAAVSNLAWQTAALTADGRPFVDSVYLYIANDFGRFLSSVTGLGFVHDYPDSSWVRRLGDHSVGNYFSEARSIVHYRFESEPRDVVTLFRKLYSPGVVRPDGLIAINLRRDVVSNLLGRHLVVLGAAGDPLFANLETAATVISEDRALLTRAAQQPSESLVRTALRSDGYLVFNLGTNRLGWVFLALIPSRLLHTIPSLLLAVCAALAIAALTAGTLFSLRAERMRAAQLHGVISLMEAARSGATLPATATLAADDYSRALHGVITEFLGQHYQAVRESERHYRARAMELQALQAQVNPHFVFNTLETIGMKVRGIGAGHHVVTAMLEDLVSVLKYSLSRADRKVTLGDEIANAKSYINIQKMRHGGRFVIHWRVKNETLPALAVRMLIQPLLENVLHHAMGDRRVTATVKIDRCQGDVVLLVTDDGQGMEPSRLSLLQEELTPVGGPSQHVGLVNTFRRLALTFGDERCEARISSERLAGTTVEFRYPFVLPDRQEPADVTNG